MQGYCVVYKWTILKRTSPAVKCLHPTSSRREMCTSSVSNVIYHKFSHGLAFYTLNGKNVNVMLELHVAIFFISWGTLFIYLRLLRKCSINMTQTNIADPDQTPQNAAYYRVYKICISQLCVSQIKWQK